MTEQSGQPMSPTPPGWYSAPEGPFERWWDGAQWTAHTRPLGDPRAAQPSQALSSPARLAGWLILAFGVLILVGALLPWATIGPFSASGTDGDGAITLPLGVLAGACGVMRGVATKPSGLQTAVAIAALVLGVLVTLIGLVDTADVSGAATVGGGLILTVVAGFCLIGASVFALIKRT